MGVIFDCNPPVQSVQTASGSEVSRLEDNHFRFSVDQGMRNGDLASGQERSFKLSGYGYQGSVRLTAEQARQLEKAHHSPPVLNWEPTHWQAAALVLAGRFKPFLVLTGLGLAWLLSRWWSRRARLLPLLERQARLEQLIKPDSDPLVGTVIGPYRLLERLGAGGMARVYRAVPDHSLEEADACALKIVRPERDNTEYRQRFAREIAVSMTLDHPNVIRVVDFGKHEEVDYLATELIEGVTLREKIPPQGLTVGEALALFLPLLEGLEYSHRRGVVHRDLKPDNVMVTRQGLVKLMDFGLARTAGLDQLTLTGAMMGTPDYMAPEQFGSRPQPDPRSDQYSAGLILYRMLCGRLPFDDQDSMALMYSTVNESPPPPSRFRPDLPPALEAVVMRCLEKQPEKRFPGISALRDALVTASQT
ncbi:serine/threonine protein kinase [bacterium]|nr:serine/threonine protein kinase [bacterium]